jgi:hypothetical protein
LELRTYCWKLITHLVSNPIRISWLSPCSKLTHYKKLSGFFTAEIIFDGFSAVKNLTVFDSLDPWAAWIVENNYFWWFYPNGPPEIGNFFYFRAWPAHSHSRARPSCRRLTRAPPPCLAHVSPPHPCAPPPRPHTTPRPRAAASPTQPHPPPPSARPPGSMTTVGCLGLLTIISFHEPVFKSIFIPFSH